MVTITSRPELDDLMAYVAEEHCNESLQNPLRGGETFYARNLRLRPGDEDAIEPGAWAFLADKVGAIVHVSPEGQREIAYFTDYSALEEEWERVVERHQEDVEARR